MPDYFEPRPNWCKTCDATVTCRTRIGQDAWECEHGHVTTGVEAHEHSKPGADD